MGLNVTMKRPDSWVIRLEAQGGPTIRMNRNRILHNRVGQIVLLRVIVEVKLALSIAQDPKIMPMKMPRVCLTSIWGHRVCILQNDVNDYDSVRGQGRGMDITLFGLNGKTLSQTWCGIIPRWTTGWVRGRPSTWMAPHSFHQLQPQSNCDPAAKITLRSKFTTHHIGRAFRISRITEPSNRTCGAQRRAIEPSSSMDQK
ncbi:hypothetical protein RJ641_010328 [Dillenia turbinata]|uniref:Uncharacterized protein n=1 Tax=Dillenia turbinata TaxID=194707 RepID=A0AAN8UW23_9MAGN